MKRSRRGFFALSCIAGALGAEVALAACGGDRFNDACPPETETVGKDCVFRADGGTGTGGGGATGKGGAAGAGGTSSKGGAGGVVAGSGGSGGLGGSAGATGGKAGGPTGGAAGKAAGTGGGGATGGGGGGAAGNGGAGGGKAGSGAGAQGGAGASAGAGAGGTTGGSGGSAGAAGGGAGGSGGDGIGGASGSAAGGTGGAGGAAGGGMGGSGGATPECAPGDTVCDGNGLKTCDGLGYWGQPAGCMSPNPVCSGIACVAVTRVAAGGGHTCAILSDGTVRCWGSNEYGEAGLGAESAPILKPTQVPGLTSILELALGGKHSCARTKTATYCWGANESGQIGNGATGGNVPSPALVSLGSITDIVRITAGRAHSCASNFLQFSSPGHVFCWGENMLGQTGSVGSSVPTPTQVAGVSNGVGVYAGSDFTCAETRSKQGGTNLATIKCWGDNSSDQLGNNNPNGSGPSSVDQLPTLMTTTYQPTAGAYHMCALDGQGNTYCWGDGLNGELGDPAKGYAQAATVEPSFAGWTAITAGNGFTCGVDASGAVRCAGRNEVGQSGSGTISKDLGGAVATVSGLTEVPSMLAAGMDHICVIVAGNVACWGGNGTGQLGDGTMQYRTKPKPVVW